MTWKQWLKGFVSAVFNGLAAAVLLVVAVPDKFSFDDLNALGRAAVAMGLLAAANYLKRSPIDRITWLILFCLLLPATVRAQVTVAYTPEPMVVLRAMNVRDIGLWSVRACNDGPAAVTVPVERLYMASGAVRLITPERARAVVLDRRSRSKKALAAQYIGYGLSIAAVLTGFGPIAASKDVIAALALGSTVAHEARRQLDAEAPDTGPFLESMLNGPVTLEAGACATRTAFAAKMKAPATVFATIR